MGKKRGWRKLSILILLVCLSCAAPVVIPTSTPTQAVLPSVPPTSPTAEPATQPAPTVTGTSTSVFVDSNRFLPNGIASVPAGGNRVQYFDLQGQLLGELQAPGLATGLSMLGVIPGPLTFSPDLKLPPLIFYSSQNDGELWQNTDNTPALWISAPKLFAIIGRPGKSNIVYSLLETGDSGLRSVIYLSDYQNQAGTKPVMDNTNTQINAIKPLAISYKDNQPSGVWYTSVPYGIGGDIVFEPRKTLKFLDLTTSEIQSVLDLATAPVGISDNQTWIAYTPVAAAGPLSIVHNLDFSTTLTYPLLADSDRGAGMAVFSQDDQYVAWMEASGTLSAEPPTFKETIRIASTSGTTLAEISGSSLSAISSISVTGTLEPVGWLDPQTLLIEVRDASGANDCIASVKYDGSGLTCLIHGLFVGFLYP